MTPDGNFKPETEVDMNVGGGGGGGAGVEKSRQKKSISKNCCWQADFPPHQQAKTEWTDE